MQEHGTTYPFVRRPAPQKCRVMGCPTVFSISISHHSLPLSFRINNEIRSCLWPNECYYHRDRMCSQTTSIQEATKDNAVSNSQSQQPCWPEDEDDHSSLYNVYNRYTYSYMNGIFRKGKLQKKNKSIQLTQKDLFDIPRDQQAHVLSQQFWKFYREHNGNLFRTLWSLVAPLFVPAGFCQFVALVSQLSVPRE